MEHRQNVIFSEIYEHFIKPRLKCETQHLYSETNKMHQCIKFILFWNDTLHVSDGLSVHHQEFKAVHTANKQILLSALFDICLLLYVQS
jgi:hypothetical protein